MAKRDFRDESDNPFDMPLTVETADRALYGKVDMDLGKGSERMIAYPVDIDLLKADPKQPRRAIPLSIRGDWDGSAEQVQVLLQKWKVAADKELNAELNIDKILKGMEVGLDVDAKTQPIADKYIQLVQLASGIRREGLMNPIQINRMGQGGVIIAGERRWLAHHFLWMYTQDETWTMIPAQDVQPNVWKQAQENGNRSPLNAIEMARQLALLIMDMYEGDRGVKFDSWDALVSPGGSDRPFYAQVANGNLYSVKRGMMDKVLEATGLKSRARVQQYRDLLNLDDHTWRNADQENWSEGRCRRIMYPERFIKKEAVMSTIVDITPPAPPGELEVGTGYSQAYTPDSDPSHPPQSPHFVGGGQSEGDNPTPPPTPPHDVGRGETDTSVRGVEVPMGYDTPEYPPHDGDFELRGDESPRRESIYPPSDNPIPTPQPPPQQVSEGEQDEDWDVPINPVHRRRGGSELDSPSSGSLDADSVVPIITQHQLFRIIINNLRTISHQMDMKKQHDILLKMSQWTPSYIRQVARDGNEGAVLELLQTVDSALVDIRNEIEQRYWDAFADDVHTIAENERKAGS